MFDASFFFWYFAVSCFISVTMSLAYVIYSHNVSLTFDFLAVHIYINFGCKFSVFLHLLFAA